MPELDNPTPSRRRSRRLLFAVLLAVVGFTLAGCIPTNVGQAGSLEHRSLTSLYTFSGTNPIPVNSIRCTESYRTNPSTWVGDCSVNGDAPFEVKSEYAAHDGESDFNTRITVSSWSGMTCRYFFFGEKFVRKQVKTNNGGSWETVVYKTC